MSPSWWGNILAKKELLTQQMTRLLTFSNGFYSVNRKLSLFWYDLSLQLSTIKEAFLKFSSCKRTQFSTTKSIMNKICSWYRSLRYNRPWILIHISIYLSHLTKTLVAREQNRRNVFNFSEYIFIKMGKPGKQNDLWKEKSGSPKLHNIIPQFNVASSVPFDPI